MIYLNTPTKKLEVVLAGAITTSNPQVTVNFFDYYPQTTQAAQKMAEGAPVIQVADTNGTTDVTICSAPPNQQQVRAVTDIFVYNKDTVSVTVTIKLDNSGTETIFVKQTLTAGKTLFYSANGWGII